MRMSPVLLLLAAPVLLSPAAAASGQEPAGSVAFGVGLSKPLASEFFTDDGRTDCPFHDCRPATKLIYGEGAVNIGRQLEIFGRLSRGFGVFRTDVENVPVDFTTSAYGVAAGARISTRPFGNRIFGEFSLGLDRASARTDGPGFRETSPPVSAVVLLPTVGADVAVGRRAALRFTAGVGFAFVDGIGSTVEGGVLGAALVYSLGGP